MSDALFDSHAKTLLLDREPPEPPRPPRRKEAVAAQQERLRALTAEGYIARVGKTGATVWKARW
jgi:hypothetical protein